jgi:hypothetical protein
MRLRNTVATSGPEDVAVRNIPILTGSISDVNFTRMHSGFFLPIKPEDRTLNHSIIIIISK